MKRLALVTILTLGSSLVFAADAPPQDNSPGAKFIHQFDANGDGVVSKDEFIKPQLQQLSNLFDHIDTNHDGKIDINEANAFIQEYSKHMQQMRQAQPQSATPPVAH